MKLCKVRPDRSTCSACVATQEMFNVVDDCRLELVFGAETTQWFKRTAKLPKYH